MLWTEFLSQENEVLTTPITLFFVQSFLDIVKLSRYLMVTLYSIECLHKFWNLHDEGP